jgi:Staphylococcal nuclease homologue
MQRGTLLRAPGVNAAHQGPALALRLAHARQDVVQDTPETKHPSKPVQCFGKGASDRAKALLTGRKIWIQYDTSQDHRDRYGRDLVYVWLDDPPRCSTRSWCVGASRTSNPTTRPTATRRSSALPSDRRRRPGLGSGVSGRARGTPSRIGPPNGERPRLLP